MLVGHEYLVHLRQVGVACVVVLLQHFQRLFQQTVGIGVDVGRGHRDACQHITVATAHLIGRTTVGVGEIPLQQVIILALTNHLPCAVGVLLRTLDVKSPAAAITVTHTDGGLAAVLSRTALHHRLQVEVAAEVGQRQRHRRHVGSFTEHAAVRHRLCGNDDIQARTFYGGIYLFVLVRTVEGYARLPDAQVFIVRRDHVGVVLLLREIGCAALPRGHSLLAVVAAVAHRCTAVGKHPGIERLLRETGHHQPVHRHHVGQVGIRAGLPRHWPVVGHNTFREVDTRTGSHLGQVAARRIVYAQVVVRAFPHYHAAVCRAAHLYAHGVHTCRGGLAEKAHLVPRDVRLGDLLRRLRNQSIASHVDVGVVPHGHILVRAVAAHLRHHLLLFVGGTLYLIKALALAVLEDMTGLYGGHAYHHVAAPVHEVQPEVALDARQRVPYRLVAHAHVHQRLLVLHILAGTAVVRAEVTFPDDPRRRRAHTVSGGTLYRPVVVGGHKQPVVVRRQTVVLAPPVRVGLQTVAVIVNVVCVEGECGKARPVQVVVIQHIVQKLYVRQFILQGTEFHTVIREALAIRAPARFLHHAGVVRQHELLAAIHHIVAYVEVYRIRTPDGQRHETLAHPVAGIFQRRAVGHLAVTVPACRALMPDRPVLAVYRYPAHAFFSMICPCCWRSLPSQGRRPSASLRKPEIPRRPSSPTWRCRQ